MKSFGRLLLAAALIVPAGVMTAQSAGATPHNTATCTGNAGTLHLTPGLRSTDKTGQTIANFKSGTVKNPSADVGTLSGCHGVGIDGNTGGTFAFSLKGAGGLTCASARGKTFTGTGQIVWDASGSNAHIVTKLRVQLTINTYIKATFAGVVDSTYLKGTKLAGTVKIPPTLKPVGGGGSCQNKARVKSLAYTQTSDTTL